MPRVRRPCAVLATLLAAAAATTPLRHSPLSKRALHLTGGANATSLAPEPKAPSDASLTARLFGAIRKTVRLTLRLLGFGKDEDASDDAAPATGKKKKAAAKKRRSPARASPAQRQAQRISRELTDFVENRAEINHRASRLASRVDCVRADALRRLRRSSSGRDIVTTREDCSRVDGVRADASETPRRRGRGGPSTSRRTMSGRATGVASTQSINKSARRTRRPKNTHRSTTRPTAAR